MRILFCNKYNFRFSGTEVYLFELMDLLRSHGHEVALFSMTDTRGEPTPYDRHFVPHIDFKSQSGWGRVTQVPRLIYSPQARHKLRGIIREFRPDIAHIRNIYHHLTPSILWELKSNGIPVLYHLNDFKLLCPSYNMVSNGAVCERCKGGAFWHALRSSCYRGKGARMALTLEAYAHLWIKTYQQCVDLFVAPSKFVRDKFVEHGWDGSRFQDLPHFQEAHQLRQPVPANGGLVLYYGRLSPEKGVADLLHAMRQIPELRLLILGDGPQRVELQELAAALRLSNVEFVGNVNAAERDRLIRRSRFTVLPTHAYETLGKTILESYAEGRAVIATDLGSRREFVKDGETGLLYRCGDVSQLSQSIRTLAADAALAEQMGRAGWELVREHLSPEKHYSKLLGFYESLATRQSGRSRPQVREVRVWPWNGRQELTTAAPRLRVAFIGGRGVISKYSGIESYYEQVGKRLADMGHEVTVYCRNHFTPAITEYNGMHVLRLPSLRSKHLETFVHTGLSTAHALWQGHDLVHYHALGPALFSWIPRLCGTKTLVTVQGLDWQRKKWGRFASAVLKLGEHASATLPNQTMVVSQTLLRHYRDVHGGEPVYVPNGGVLRDRAMPSKFAQWGIHPGEYVLFLGRFSPEKGCHLLIEAFEGLDAGVKLVMAGGASYTDAYTRELLQHANERIRMLAWVSGQELEELLTNAMVFVLPSDMEGLSLALLDAMGAGVCVLASDVPENREAVDGVGFVFESGNAADLRERLGFLIANPEIREAAGRAARKRVEEQYDWDNISRQIEKVYLDVLGLSQPETVQKKPSTRELSQDESDSRKRLVS
jgi:glycosyltransferase involved in cell wall biosynthesis